MAMSENSKTLLNYLKGTAGQDLTVHDVSAATGLAVNSITGAFNAFVKKGLGERVLAEVTNEDGTHTQVKLLKLTDAGMAYTGEDAE